MRICSSEAQRKGVSDFIEEKTLIKRMNVTIPKPTGIQWVYSGSKAKARQQRVILGTCSPVSGPQCFQGPTNKSYVLRGGTTTAHRASRSQTDWFFLGVYSVEQQGT